MKNEIVTVNPEEKREIEKKVLSSNGSNQNGPAEILTLILDRLSLLEEKIDRIEYQTKNHWVK